MSKKAVFILVVLLCLSTNHAFSRDLPPSDQAFKDKNLASLKPLGLVYDEAESEKWREFIRIAAENEDQEVAKKFFTLARQGDGSIADACHLALFALFKRNSRFFITAANEFFQGDFHGILAGWINESDDIHLDEIEKYCQTASDSEIVKTFLKAASQRNQEFAAELEKRNTRTQQSQNDFQKEIKSIIQWHH